MVFGMSGMHAVYVPSILVLEGQFCEDLTRVTPTSGHLVCMRISFVGCDGGAAPLVLVQSRIDLCPDVGQVLQ